MNIHCDNVGVQSQPLDYLRDPLLYLARCLIVYSLFHPKITIRLLGARHRTFLGNHLQ